MFIRCRLLLASLLLIANFAAADHNPALTVIGALKSGNTEGTIPPWTGGITKPPAGYSPGDWHPDPYSNDQILFTIDNDNAAQFGDSLSAGHRAMLNKYPDTYRLNIYPTRRSASHPQSALDHTIKYSGKAKIVDDGAGVEGIVVGTPFPHPQNGEQAIWNARLRYRAGGYSGYYTHVITTASGAYDFGVWQHELEFMYSDHRTTLENFDNVQLRGLLRTLRPAKDSGGMFVYLRYLNALGNERRNWSYHPGKRRVKRTSNSPRGAPMYLSSGIHLWDQDEMWRGQITDFNWTLIGKREMYVPYNAYQLHSGDTPVKTIIGKGHINQQLARYELHRVWVVEANLKEGREHFYKRRRFYIDEDSWLIMFAEHFDDNNLVDRFSESHDINYYEVPLLFPTLETYYKLDTERYYVSKIDNEYTPFDFSFDQTKSFYSPGRLKMKAKR
jgi:hypothetical protein